MGKRSDFERIPKDAYQTIDPKAVDILVGRHVQPFETFIEPCVGDGFLKKQLEDKGLECVQAFDIKEGKDALTEPLVDADLIITNPPWDRKILHPLIERFIEHERETYTSAYLLFDADWMHTKQAKPYLEYCSKIVSVGRLKWIPDTTMTGKDNCCWYLFEGHPTITYMYF